MLACTTIYSIQSDTAHTQNTANLEDDTNGEIILVLHNRALPSR